MAKAVCCLGESKTFDYIPIEEQIGGYLCSKPTISIKIWRLRLIIGCICWISTLYSIIFVTMGWNATHGKNFLLWFCFYTHWTMLFQCIYWVIVLYLHHQILFDTKNDINSRAFYTMKVANIIGMCSGIGLMGTFWPFVWAGPHTYPGREVPYIFDNIFKHGLNAILIFFDFLMNLSIYRYKDIWILMSYGIIYQLFNAIYCLSGGSDDSGNKWLYEIYDWNNNPWIQVSIYFANHVIYYVVPAFIKKTILSRYLPPKTDRDVGEPIELANLI